MIKQFQAIKLFHRSVTTVCNTSHLPTIYALATPPGRKSAIAVVRISGEQSKYIYRKLTDAKTEPKPRSALLRNLYNIEKYKDKKTLLDNALIFFFQSPKSFTGEDSLELHLHGGKAICNAVIKTIETLHNRDEGIEIRQAQPGEFSQRAFQNGKYDLTEIEGIKEIIDSETESQRLSALSSFMGQNKKMFNSWREKIVENIAQLTAIIDFGEDIDIEDTEKLFNRIEANIIGLERDVHTFLKRVEKANILQDGIRMTLIGVPNTGKSSLINKITSDEISIVSDIPGTTRDSIDAIININGYKVIISDTAGIRKDTNEKIEVLGIERSKKMASRSDICLVLIDPNNKPLLSNEIIDLLQAPEIKRKHLRIIVNKTDLIKNENILENLQEEIVTKYNLKIPINFISCATESGIEKLIYELTDTFDDLSNKSEDGNPIIVSERVVEILKNDVVYGINEFKNFKNYNNDVVMATESLKYAADGIGKITGDTVGVDEVLGSVFANFCVGK
ncbi:hypothetical protein Kpol_1056p1 [Vanderwaltozyma polyspora DSM 70294]|uniref:TrmE-type G domain-containing protein n=1 Tax=Vanderwaltozyma polyspora (strain ATCC 22028 / DSM 70294 / BCRC 21397 / CBS 2163 / NBRC 10782 / NRRL Y-8283 / UCD 57-17) TaxID=436907 RepID=A7TLK9_VANPO|nr:uncharacterized protein Kpol_1056p1 [Vanderwaltozyma polyspora DSM 70294]EDO16801.1 hypothetical protein Kpol_1056p1 [Vanderwaltozyma polyspora DSM 70294]